jgi:hypothetical protein
MKFSEYVKNLNDLLKERPETADYDVVTSKDDEGNGYNLVRYEPQVGSYDDEDREFKEEQVTNAVCVN